MRKNSVYINSVNRTSGTATDFKTVLNRRIQNISCIEIKAIEIPFSYYPVNSSNNTLRFTNAAATNYTATITPKNYTGDELAAELKTQMNASGFAGFNVTYDDSTLRLTITNSSQFNLLKTSATTAHIILGISATSGLVTSYTSANAINISGTNHIYIQSSTLSSGRQLSYQDSNRVPIIYRVPVDCNFAEIIREKTEASGSNSFDFDGGSFSLQEIDFRLLDENMNVLDLNGLNWSIELQIIARQD